MRTLYSSENFDPKKSFRLWREIVTDRLGLVEQKQVDDGPFEALIQATDIADIQITNVSESALQTEITQATRRRRHNTGSVFVLIQLAGVSVSSQDGRDATQKAGDIIIFDHRPSIRRTSRIDQSLFLELPRERLEDMLGPTRLYTAMTTGLESVTTSLAVDFFLKLMRNCERLSPDAAKRVSKIGIDLIVASFADRLAQDMPRSLHGTLVFQRAKAYVEVNLGDPTLDPPQLAAATGVSLRRLQELFNEQGQHISDWIWDRRLNAAQRRLSDCAYNHLAISTIAHSCGFTNPTHFSRRFKDRYNMTPSEFREVATFDKPHLLPAKIEKL